MKDIDKLIDKTDVGIIMSDYMGSQWNGNMRDDIVDMVNTKYKALIATQIEEAYDRGYADACLKHNWFGEDNE